MTPDQESWNAKVTRRNARFERIRSEVQRKPGALRPFKRASKLYTDIMNTRAALQHDLFALQMALSEFPPYISRGHGGRHRTRNRQIGAQWSQDRSKPYPNPGRSEAARRVFQCLPREQRAYIRSIEGEVTQ